MLLKLPLSRLTLSSICDLRGHAIPRHNERGVQVNTPLGNTARGMAQQPGDGKFGKPKVAGDTGEGVPQNVRGHAFKFRLPADAIQDPDDANDCNVVDIDVNQRIGCESRKVFVAFKSDGGVRKPYQRRRGI
jgi:hypothetical protein